jgi:hypothetical protein
VGIDEDILYWVKTQEFNESPVIGGITKETVVVEVPVIRV